MKSNSLTFDMVLSSQVVPSAWKAFWVKEERKEALEEVSKYLEILEKELKGNFFGGESIGVVDITGNFIAQWIPAVQELVGVEILTEAKFPKLCKWSHDFATHPLIKEASPSKEELIAIFKPRLNPTDTN